MNRVTETQDKRKTIINIENWSILLDLKIIIQTILNIFKGEKKAY